MARLSLKENTDTWNQHCITGYIVHDEHQFKLLCYCDFITSNRLFLYIYISMLKKEDKCSYHWFFFIDKLVQST